MAKDVFIKGLKSLFQRLRRIGRVTKSRPVFDEIGMYLVTSIKERTLSGRDINDELFTPYSERYKFFRQKKGLPTNIVDLFLTGSMLASLTHTASDDSASIFFMPGQDKSGMSNPAKAFFLHQDREFFGMTNDDVENIIDIYESYITRRI